ncbi:GDSL-type esterase/lipase family protein [Desertivirga arenae]|uniref:GDSL-type esterase/lipase family protein n=1 Tax=Desertivirga arenae TaxID=2810309 RepID=UPI001A97146A|nr:GDSL-type esterase/lipase family protein [Pedobacter sp. SYSU D00823]
MKFKILAFLLLLSTIYVSAQTLSNKAMPDFTVRKGLPNFYRKISDGKPVTVAYLGGSITEAANGWRDQSAEKIRQRFPNAKINAINAGIGGTGSDLGVFRLRAQVLSQKPDLVFVEFAVNDISKPSTLIHKAMEGIVRQIWKDNRETDICFVYTLTGDMGVDLGKGKIPQSTAAMEEIAQHYGIPTVSMGLKVVQLATEGKLVYKGAKDQYPDKIVFSADNVHPFPETGQKLYAEALSVALDSIFIHSAQKNGKRLVKPFIKDNWEAAKLIPVEKAVKTGNWEKVTTDDPELQRIFKKPFTEFIKSSEKGASLSFRFKGQVAGLYDVVGPGCGQYELSVDGGDKELVPRFDSYSTYYRPQYFLKQGLSKGLHTVRLEVSGRQLDKKEILSQRNNQTMDKESRYQENACYAGYIMLIGDLQN